MRTLDAQMDMLKTMSAQTAMLKTISDQEAMLKAISAEKVSSIETTLNGLRAREMQRLVESDPLHKIRRDMERMYGPLGQIVEILRQHDEAKKLAKLMEPAYVFENYAFVKQCAAADSMAMAVGMEHSKWAALTPALDRWREENRLLRQFNGIASMGLQTGVAAELERIYKQQEAMTRLLADWDRSLSAFSKLEEAMASLSLRSTPTHWSSVVDEILAGKASDFVYKNGAPEKRKSPANGSARPYFANWRMYEATSNVSGAVEAVLRDAVNDELVRYFGSDWIDTKALIPADKIKDMKEKQAKDAKDGDVAGLHEYLTLGEVCVLLERTDLWAPVMSKLFIADRKKVLKVLSGLHKPRNISTHRRSNLSFAKVEQTFKNARFVAEALRDYELLDIIDELEDGLPLVNVQNTIH